MVLESTVICLDNSEWMRNGDYIPTRMEAQHDAANLIAGAKTQSNPESTVGVLTMAGKRCELLVSPTDDMSKILNSLHNVPINGRLNFSAAVQVAQLALKHRRNKNGGQRIIIFVGSPVEDDQRQMLKVAKLLKKNNVACDIVSMGELDDNQEKLQAFVEACNSNGNSHLITIPAGVLPSDVLISSPVIQDGDMGAAMAASAAGGAGSGVGDFGGINANIDPELALALRVSMEEERARQEAASKANAGGSGLEALPEGFDPMALSAMDEEERLLQQALALSMAESGLQFQDAPAPEVPTDVMDSSMDPNEDSALEAALQLSMAPEEKADGEDINMAVAPPQTATQEEPQQFLDPDFVNQLLGSLPGVDPSDPKIQAALQQLSGKEDKDEKKPDEK